MQFEICISKEPKEKFLENSNYISGNAILKINYTHPKIILEILLLDETSFLYFYEGTLESLLKSNGVQSVVNAEYFINGLNHINYLKIRENIATFKFPLQVNFISNVIKVVLVVLYFYNLIFLQEVIYNINQMFDLYLLYNILYNILPNYEIGGNSTLLSNVLFTEIRIKREK
jgi:hypothetical protein